MSKNKFNKEEYVDVLLYISIHAGRDKSRSEIAKDLGITLEKLNNHVNVLRSKGVDIPKERGNRGIMAEVVSILRNKHPELLKPSAREGRVPVRILSENK